MNAYRLKKYRLFMNCVLLEEMALYGVAGEPACIDNIIIIPAFYEFFPELEESDIDSDISLEEYLNSNGDRLTEICPRFARFFKEEGFVNSSSSGDAIWVHAKILDLFQYYPPTIDWRYGLPDFSFLAVTFNDSRELASAHPFSCIEYNLQSYLEFSCFTDLKHQSIVSSAFWKLLLAYPGLGTFEQKIQGNCYDDYGSISMGSNFITGYQNDTFYLDIVWEYNDILFLDFE
ncbi:hypothetical protein C7B77_15490 [Chamaesiphon polymorphus CCALA 037]|uniref:Uncharacterized protein n=2 Tax=Chamaesiphon TaxID=217161 RepID=A0A2T1GD33_9CYAN|nr:hypothetical protein C7B77_15490 [Chamaesiphon polymorphus CCALA 037]